MPVDYGTRSVHLTFGGKLFVAETWSCGLRITGSGRPLVTEVPEMEARDLFCANEIEDVSTKVSTYWATAKTYVNTQASLGWVKMAANDTNGKMGDGSSAAVHTFGSPVAGTGGIQFPQLAVAISLTTGIPRGRAHTGRYYLPFGTISPPDANGNLAQPDVQAMADAAAAFLNSLNDWSGIDPLWDPVVSIMSGLDTGTHRRVSGVRVGRTIDTQRRRRSQIPEQYVLAGTAVV